MWAAFPQPSYMPCDECGVSVDQSRKEFHECDEIKRLDYQMFLLKEEIDSFEDQLKRYLDSKQGQFDMFYASRKR